MEFPRKMYIDGSLVDGQFNLDVINPATAALTETVAAAGPDDVNRALAAAQSAFPKWCRTSIAERQSWMRRLGDAVIESEEWLRACIHHEMGKPWQATQEDFDSLRNALAYYAEEIARVGEIGLADRAGTHSHRLVREPAGVVVAYLAWNFPLLNLAFKLAPAMAAGCPIIIKPAPSTPISAYAVGELCHRIGLPAGVVNILATESNEVADGLTSSTIPALLTLIGSTATGRHLMKTGATSIKRYSLEMGGNAPALVLADADLDRAADTICGVKFGNSGQICVAPNRVYVQAAVADAFERKVAERARAVRVGWDRHASISMGPVIDEKAWNRIDRLVRDALADGARLVDGGGRPAGMNTGHYYAPTVLGDVSDDMRIAREEIFGPVVSLLTFEEMEEAVTRANDTDAGLASYIFTRDVGTAERIAARLRFGEVQVNGVKYDIDLPHGGIKQSGVGHDCSALALEDYLVTKRITRALIA